MIESAELRATRAAYDSIATKHAEYAESPITQLDDVPLDRAMLGAFAEFVRATGGQRCSAPRKIRSVGSRRPTCWPRKDGERPSS